MTSQNNNSVESIVIVGGGTAGWMTAAALAKKIRPLGVDITLVESAEIGTVGVGEATLPNIRDFNRMLGIDERELMARTAATIKLGIEFCDWGQIGDSYIHPFGHYGESIGPADFHHYWMQQRKRGEAAALGDYCLPIVMAKSNRFGLPPPNPEKDIDAFSYAFQFDASLYGAFLSEFAQRQGVVRREGKIVASQLNSETGFIASVQLESGEQLNADLFVDCSGFRGLLIEQQLQTGYDDWSEWLICNRAVAVPCETVGEVGPYTRATARTAGWQWRIPLQHRVGNGHVYCDRYISDDEATGQLMSNVEGDPLAEPRQLFFKTGKRRKLWNRNCIAIGLSGGFLEPLESTSIDLIQSGITNLIAQFPDKSCADTDRDEYNRLMDLEFARIRDFLMLHYVANQRDDAPMWRDLREMDWPESLTEKIEAFRHRGLVPEYASGLFQPPSWLSVFIGQNIMAESHDPRVDSRDAKAVERELIRISKSISERASRFDEHLTFLENYGARFAPSATAQT